jgi:branched-chain amino acid transport system ATP-binding protein
VLRIDGLAAGYGTSEILHGIDLRLGKGQWLCITGPHGAGKSTILNSIFGLADVRRGRIEIGGRNAKRLGTNAKLREAGVAYALPNSSLFRDLTVEQNLWLEGRLIGRPADTRDAAERLFARYPCLAALRAELVGALSIGELRLLEIARALVVRPGILLVDEPFVGVGPAHLELIFDVLTDLRDCERMSMVIAESDAQRGLELADIGCVVVAGEVTVAGTGVEVLRRLASGRDFARPHALRDVSRAAER